MNLNLPKDISIKQYIELNIQEAIKNDSDFDPQKYYMELGVVHYYSLYIAITGHSSYGYVGNSEITMAGIRIVPNRNDPTVFKFYKDVTISPKAYM